MRALCLRHSQEAAERVSQISVFAPVSLSLSLSTVWAVILVVILKQSYAAYCLSLLSLSSSYKISESWKEQIVLIAQVFFFFFFCFSSSTVESLYH